MKADAGLEDSTTVRVRYAETDAMGWVYYAVYLHYFEVGRTELIRKAWKSYREIEENGLKLPVLEAGCKYFRGAHYDDLLRIESRMSLLSGARIRFDYRILIDHENVLCAEGFTEHCFVSEAGRPVPIPKEMRELAGS